VLIRGYISEQPVLKQTDQGIDYVRLHIAANEIVCEGEKRDPQTDRWHSVVFFGRRAQEMCKLLIGDRVRLRGDRLLATESKGRWLVVVSNIINPVLERLPADKPSSIETEGWVFVEPKLQRYKDGTCFVRVMLEAESVRVQGKLRDANHADHRWQFAIFLDQQAENLVATAKMGAKVRVTGDLTFLPWVAPGQRFSTNEIRNASFTLITPAHGHLRCD
jgi:single-stranded DNA-binding protein